MVASNKEKGDLLNALKRLTVHDHACLIYKSHEEQFAAAIPFIRLGLERHEKCVYVADENTTAAVIEALGADGVDVKSVVDSGGLAVESKQDTYLRGGAFDPDAMIAFLKKATASAKAAGFSALRVTGEMTWALGPEPGIDRLIEYESKLNDFFKDNDALAVCQYNSNRFDANTLLGVIDTHPITIIGDVVCENELYTSPQESAHLKPEGHLKKVLTLIVKQKQTADALTKTLDRYKDLFDNAPLAYLSVDMEGKVQEVNKRGAEMLGRAREEVIGAPVMSLFADTPAGKTKAKELFARFVAGAEITDEELEMRRGDDSLIWVSLSVTPIYDDGRVIASRSMAVDITARKAAEKTIRDQSDAIRMLSTPVLQVRKGLLAIPIIGQIDTYRARQLTEQMLYRIRSTRAKVVVLDITGVPVVDSAVANHIVQTVQAARLLGASVIVTGISSENAQTLVRIGVELSRLNTTGDLQSGIEEADRLLGYRTTKTGEAA